MILQKIKFVKIKKYFKYFKKFEKKEKEFKQYQNVILNLTKKNENLLHEMKRFII